MYERTMIEIRDYQFADIKKLALLANNRNVSRYLVPTFPYPYTKADAKRWVLKGSKENQYITKAIEFQGEFAGTIGIAPQRGWKNHCAEIGYWLGEPYWGKGIATEALNAMTGYAFEVCQFRKLFAPVMGPNKASMKVLEKCDFILEGVFKNEVYKDGRFFDIYHFARLR